MGNQKSGKVRMVNFRADLALCKRVAEFANAQGVGMSEAIRMLIEKGLRGTNG